MNKSIPRRQVLAAATAVSCASAVPRANGAFARAALSAKQRDAVQRVARTAVDSGDIPGVVALVWRKGELCCDVVAGFRDVERGIPMDRTAIFGIASMSKPITVALALTLLDEGKLKLDDPITRWAPEFAQMRVLRRPDGPLDDTVPAARAITVKDLMTHHSGLAYGFMTPPPLGAALLTRFGMGMDSELTPDAWMKALAELPLVYQPGERFNYGHSIDVLGFVVARVLGTDLRSAMRGRLFEPLGMVDTDFWIPQEKRSRMPAFYLSTQPGQFIPSNVSSFTADAPSGSALGGQGLVSTADDYLRFARMLMHDGELDRVRVLKPQTVQLMRSNRLTAAQLKYPFLGQPFTQGFGLGVSVITDATQPSATGSVGSFGWPGAFGGWWQADPQEDTVLLWLQQCTPAPPEPGAAMPRIPGADGLRQFRKAAYDSQGSNT
jgi:CubicO group peptidase (beta-lactamase class C family)